MTNVRKIALMVLISGDWMALGCSTDGPVDIGSRQMIGSQLTDYAATWDGYAEAFNFWPDGSDRVRLIVDGSGHGTLEIGDAAPIPPATDPNVGYPPGGYSNLSPSSVVAGSGRVAPLVEGFRYAVHDVAIDAYRIHLGLDPADLYTGWCPLQRSYPSDISQGLYSCVPLASGTTITPSTTPGGTCTLTPPNGTPQAEDCVKLDLCFNGGACACSSSGCTANTVPAGSPLSQYPIQLDGALDSAGTTLTATLALPERVTVVLHRK